MPIPPAMKTKPEFLIPSTVNRPLGPSRYTRRSGRRPTSNSVKSPSALTVNSMRCGYIAVDAIVNG